MLLGLQSIGTLKTVHIPCWFSNILFEATMFHKTFRIKTVAIVGLKLPATVKAVSEFFVVRISK